MKMSDPRHLVAHDRAARDRDRCPQSRDVWLDRGELDRIIERALARSGSQPAQALARRRRRPPVLGAAPDQEQDVVLSELFEVGE